jgi:carbonic anhydrase
VRALGSLLALAALLAAGCGSDDEEAAVRTVTVTETVTAPVPQGEDAEQEFAYSGEDGPERWGELSPEWRACGEGRRQSPIDLEGAEPTELPDLRFDYERSRVTATDTGHAIAFKAKRENALSIGGRRVGILEQFHVHGPSEHTREGRPHPLEIHFVHADAEGALTVVGVFVEEGEANAAIDRLSRELPAGPADAAEHRDDIDPSDLLPDDRASIRYSGSLTTPPCSEDVSWIVLTEPITMSAAQIARFRERYEKNARPAQPRNDRALRSSS